MNSPGELPAYVFGDGTFLDARKLMYNDNKRKSKVVKKIQVDDDLLFEFELTAK